MPIEYTTSYLIEIVMVVPVINCQTFDLEKKGREGEKQVIAIKLANVWIYNGECYQNFSWTYLYAKVYIRMHAHARAHAREHTYTITQQKMWAMARSKICTAVQICPENEQPKKNGSYHLCWGDRSPWDKTDKSVVQYTVHLRHCQQHTTDWYC